MVVLGEVRGLVLFCLSFYLQDVLILHLSPAHLLSKNILPQIIVFLLKFCPITLWSLGSHLLRLIYDCLLFFRVFFRVGGLKIRLFKLIAPFAFNLSAHFEFGSLFIQRPFFQMSNILFILFLSAEFPLPKLHEFSCKSYFFLIPSILVKLETSPMFETFWNLLFRLFQKLLSERLVWRLHGYFRLLGCFMLFFNEVVVNPEFQLSIN